MKTTSITLAALFVAAIHSQAAGSIRWLGLHMNTVAQSPSEPFIATTTSDPNPITDILNVPFGPGPDFTGLIGQANASSGTSNALTTWSIDPNLNTVTLDLNHVIDGPIAVDNFAGSEGVLYFYALSPGTLTVTYDYGFEGTTDADGDFESYKVSERGRSRARVKNNAFGLYEETSGLTEYTNRDGSRTFMQEIAPADGLVALQFDFRILEDPMPTSITDGYLTMTFTPIPEPSSALLGLGALGLLVRRKR